jgi:hypothetical protein
VNLATSRDAGAQNAAIRRMPLGWPGATVMTGRGTGEVSRSIVIAGGPHAIIWTHADEVNQVRPIPNSSS